MTGGIKTTLSSNTIHNSKPTNAYNYAESAYLHEVSLE